VRDLTKARILVTGGGGFLGRWVCAALREQGAETVVAPRRGEFDLREKLAVEHLFADTKPEIVIHLAAVVGGIGANRASPGRFFYDNAVMGLHVMECARRASVAKFVSIGTICSYPKYAPVPFAEEDLWNGYPEETNAPYGLAKKMLLVQGQAYRQEYGLNAITLLPVNVYGPGDNFDLDSGHVIPSLIRKAIEAREKEHASITAWGSGRASREFLFVRDAARAIVAATQAYDGEGPVNIGSGSEITIADLVAKVCRACGFRGSVEWDAGKPDGQPRRFLSTDKARQLFGFTATTGLAEGLKETVEWYEARRKSADAGAATA